MDLDCAVWQSKSTEVLPEAPRLGVRNDNVNRDIKICCSPSKNISLHTQEGNDGDRGKLLRGGAKNGQGTNAVAPDLDDVQLLEIKARVPANVTN